MPLTTAELVALFGVFTKCLTAYNLFVTLPLYVAILRLIHVNRTKAPYSSPFYSCFFALGLVDITKYLLYIVKKCSYWDWVLPFFLPANVPNLTANVIYTVIWILSCAQWQLNILIGANRFVSIVLPTFYKRHWDQRANRLLLAFVFSLSTVLAGPILSRPVCFATTTIVSNDSDGNVTKLTGPVFDAGTRTAYYMVTKVHNYIILAICLLGYPLILFRVRKLNLKDKLVGMELRMVAGSLFLIGSNGLYLAYFFVWDALVQRYAQYGYYAEWCLYVIVDVYDMMGPYALLITSPHIRAVVLPFQCQFRPPPPPPLSSTHFGGGQSNITISTNTNGRTMLLRQQNPHGHRHPHALAGALNKVAAVGTVSSHTTNVMSSFVREEDIRQSMPPPYKERGQQG